MFPFHEQQLCLLDMTFALSVQLDTGHISSVVGLVISVEEKEKEGDNSHSILSETLVKKWCTYRTFIKVL